MQKIVERVLKRLLLESTADTSGLAAMVSEIGGHRWAVAYDIKEAEAFLNSLNLDSMAERGRFKSLGDALSPTIRAMASVKEPPDEHGPLRGAWEISMVAGPGKLAYGMAYALAGDKGIVPDRETVSPAARRAWRNAAGKLKREPIDDMTAHEKGDFDHEGHTPDPNDDGRKWGPKLDGDVLDFVYYPSGGETAMLDELRRRHEDLAKKFPQLKKLDDYFRFASMSFFSERFEDEAGPNPPWY